MTEKIKRTLVNDSERDLIEWLGKEDFSQYGECHGKELNGLIEKGLARIHGAGEHQNFIAKGTSQMYRAVSLTDAGWEKVKELWQWPQTKN